MHKSPTNNHRFSGISLDCSSRRKKSVMNAKIKNFTMVQKKTCVKTAGKDFYINLPNRMCVTFI